MKSFKLRGYCYPHSVKPHYDIKLPVVVVNKFSGAGYHGFIPIFREHSCGMINMIVYHHRINI